MWTLRRRACRGSRELRGALMSTPYADLIPAPNNQKPNFMQVVDVLTAAAASITAGIQSIVPAFNLNTPAVGAQLDVIGQWVGQSRIISDVLIVGFFGFADDVAAATFGEETDPSIGGPFYEEGAPFEGTTVLSDPDYRTILRARIVRNQSYGSLADIESALQFIFGSPAKIADNGTLSLAITVIDPWRKERKAARACLPRRQ